MAGIADAHHRRDAEFARGHGTVREWAAAFGDDAGGVVEERCPGGIGGAGDEDGTLRKVGELRRVGDDEDFAADAAGATAQPLPAVRAICRRCAVRAVFPDRGAGAGVLISGFSRTAVARRSW